MIVVIQKAGPVVPTAPGPIIATDKHLLSLSIKRFHYTISNNTAKEVE